MKGAEGDVGNCSDARRERFQCTYSEDLELPWVGVQS